MEVYLTPEVRGGLEDRRAECGGGRTGTPATQELSGRSVRNVNVLFWSTPGPYVIPVRDVEGVGRTEAPLLPW